MPKGKVFKIQMYGLIKKSISLFVFLLLGIGVLGFLFSRFSNFNIEKIFDSIFPIIFILIFLPIILIKKFYTAELKVEGGLILITNKKGEITRIPIQAGLVLGKERSKVNGNGINKYVLNIGHTSNDDKQFISFAKDDERSHFIREVRSFLNNGILVEEEKGFGKKKIELKNWRWDKAREYQEKTKTTLVKNQTISNKTEASSMGNPLEEDKYSGIIRIVVIIVIIVVGYMMYINYFK